MRCIAAELGRVARRLRHPRTFRHQVPHDRLPVDAVEHRLPHPQVRERIVGTSAAGGALVTGGFQQVVTLIRGPGDSTIHAVTLTKLAVVVVEETPLAVTIVPPAAPLAADGTLDVTVRITRAGDFAEPVEVTFPASMR